jgi:hypothetical protein
MKHEFILATGFYSGCQKNVPFDKRFFVTTTYAPSFIPEHLYGKGYKFVSNDNQICGFICNRT